MLAEAMHPVSESVIAKGLPATGEVGGTMHVTETILARAAQYATRHSCSAQCPEGEPCCLDAEAQHELHICTDSTCRCHTEQRYTREREAQHAR